MGINKNRSYIAAPNPFLLPSRAINGLGNMGSLTGNALSGDVFTGNALTPKVPPALNSRGLGCAACGMGDASIFGSGTAALSAGAAGVVAGRVLGLGWLASGAIGYGAYYVYTRFVAPTIG